MMSNSILNKQKQLKDLFTPLANWEQKYLKIIELGRLLPPFPQVAKQDIYLVPGCQSRLYLLTLIEHDKLTLYSASDALISMGLSALIIFVYNKEPPDTIFKYPPNFLEELGIFKHLSPGRSHGLNSLIVKMKQDVIQLLK